MRALTVIIVDGTRVQFDVKKKKKENDNNNNKI